MSRVHIDSLERLKKLQSLDQHQLHARAELLIEIKNVMEEQYYNFEGWLEREMGMTTAAIANRRKGRKHE